MAGEYFISSCPSSLFDDSNPDWVPSLKLGYSQEKVLPLLSRFANIRLNLRRIVDVERNGAAKLQQENLELREELYKLTKANERLLSYDECYWNDYAKVFYYTGLTSNTLLMSLFQLILPGISAVADPGGAKDAWAPVRFSKYCFFPMFLSLFPKKRA